LVYEVEEAVKERTREVRVEVSEDGGRTYRQILVQEYNLARREPFISSKTCASTFSMPAVCVSRLSQIKTAPVQLRLLRSASSLRIMTCCAARFGPVATAEIELSFWLEALPEPAELARLFIVINSPTDGWDLVFA